MILLELVFYSLCYSLMYMRLLHRLFSVEYLTLNSFDLSIFTSSVDDAVVYCGVTGNNIIRPIAR